MNTIRDIEYMKMAIELANKGCGKVCPNPLVGAVIVKGNKIIGKGYHEKCGELHAERKALQNCTQSPKGATMYVTLEPCCHYGRQGPCVEAIIESGIIKVVVGSNDPNPLVSGKGIEILKNNGIEVVENIMHEECNELNRVFFHYIKNKTPYVIMKYAMTMDGKISTYKGFSKWISCEKSRIKVHEDRNRYSGIMVGVGTVISDNPMLNCRIERGCDPIRIICDSNLKTPIDSNVVSTAKEVPTLIATCCEDLKRYEIYEERGCKIVKTPEKNGRVDLEILMKLLGDMGIDSILLEGGSTLNWEAIKSKIVNMTQVYIAPKIFGGTGAKSPVGGLGFEMVENGVILKNSKFSKIGEDFLIESELEYVYGNN